MSTTIQFFANSVTIEPWTGNQVHVTLEAKMMDVVEDISVSDRLHEIEPIDVVECAGPVKLLSAMSAPHFCQWIEEGGDYYEALNAIGIEKIREWIDTYTSGE